MKTLLIAFAQNKVFANLLMVTFLMAGILSATVMVREDMPDMQLDTLVITVAYPGADPEEVEEGISRKIEEVIDGLEGVDDYTSTSLEGSSSTVITVRDGFDPDLLLDRVRNEVDGISTFPEDAENPSIIRPQIQKAVISLALVSNMSEARLKEWTDSIKKEIQQLEGVSQANVSGTRSYEIAVEISQANLLKYNLSIENVTEIIGQSSMNQAGGTIKTQDQEIRLRTMGRKYTGNELARIKIIKGTDGQTLYLEDIADIKDGFTENNLSIRANGKPAALINVLAGDEDTIKIADRVRQFQEEKNEQLPEGSEIIILSDNTESTRANLDILFSNAVMGLVLVFILLWLFMDTKLSFWAGMGIPISLLGGLSMVHFSGISLNKVTLFGLIMVLGIVADDAIVVGESIFYHRKKGASPLDAVVMGVSEVGMPVIAAVLTTIVAFFPLYNIDGMMGKFTIALPTAVIACLVISLVECLVMLPAHLLEDTPCPPPKKNRLRIFIDKFHRTTVNSMDKAAQRIYLPFLKKAVAFRYLFLSLCIFMLLLCAGLVKGGIIKFDVFPKQSSSILVASIEFAEGSPYATTQQAVERLEKAAWSAARQVKGLSQNTLIVNTLATIGQEAGEKNKSSDTASPHIGGVRVTLVDSAISGVHSDDFLVAWEKASGRIMGVQSLDFSASNSGPPGAPIEICFRGEKMDQITAAANKTIADLKTIDGVSQVFSDNAPGKNELKFRLKKEAEYLGLSLSNLANQVYGAYYGAEAVKIQRGNDEVEVNVRLTAGERQTLSSIQELMIKTPDGDWVPLSAVADISYGPGFSTITRKNGLRQVMVSAKVDTDKTVAGEVTAPLTKGLFKELKAKYPGIQIVLEGDAKRSSESFGSLYLWIPISIMGMFLIIATMFRSYVQPVMVLFTIPFGLVGAVLGHFIMGHMLSLLSVFGMVALSGVVVNDAIVLIERINMNLEEGMEFFDAIFQGGVRRFRAVMLTSISTIGGLLPLILETSQHAQQLIPMGISLAFGVGFATILTLVLLPCLFAITNDIRYGIACIKGRTNFYRNNLEPGAARNLMPVSGEIK
ncbi:MAG: efflux RND transporter permease subunit [Desulfobacteraceae bacterium]|nr:efflux RND transporter permease subunit [Desulfobacteraceae bacterium]